MGVGEACASSLDASVGGKIMCSCDPAREHLRPAKSPNFLLSNSKPPGLPPRPASLLFSKPALRVSLGPVLEAQPSLSPSPDDNPFLSKRHDGHPHFTDKHTDESGGVACKARG